MNCNIFRSSVYIVIASWLIIIHNQCCSHILAIRLSPVNSQTLRSPQSMYTEAQKMLLKCICTINEGCIYFIQQSTHTRNTLILSKKGPRLKACPSVLQPLDVRVEFWSIVLKHRMNEPIFDTIGLNGSLVQKASFCHHYEKLIASTPG